MKDIKIKVLYRKEDKIYDVFRICLTCKKLIFFNPREKIQNENAWIPFDQVDLESFSIGEI